MLGADGAVLGEVAAGLAHHPHGNARRRFSATGAEEQVLSIERQGAVGHLLPEEEDSKSKE